MINCLWPKWWRLKGEQCYWYSWHHTSKPDLNRNLIKWKCLRQYMRTKAAHFTTMMLLCYTEVFWIIWQWQCQYCISYCQAVSVSKRGLSSLPGMCFCLSRCIHLENQHTPHSIVLSTTSTSIKDICYMPMRHYNSSVYNKLSSIPALGIESLSQH